MNKNNISSDLLEQIKSLFDSPAEFCSSYNSYIKSRLNNETLVNWFESINEEELDLANEYYLSEKRETFSRKSFSELYAVVVRNVDDDTYEVMSVTTSGNEQANIDELFANGEIELIKKCKSSAEAAKWIASKKLRFAYSDKNNNKSDIRSSFSSLRNHCKNKDQIKAFNQLVKSFASFSKEVSLLEFLNNSWAEDVAEELANELSLINVNIYQIGSNEYHLISGKGTLTYRENTDYSTVEVCFYPKGKGTRKGECILFDGSYGFDLDAFIYIMNKL